MDLTLVGICGGCQPTLQAGRWKNKEHNDTTQTKGHRRREREFTRPGERTSSSLDTDQDTMKCDWKLPIPACEQVGRRHKGAGVEEHADKEWGFPHH
jgi:hypothetical protein